MHNLPITLSYVSPFQMLGNFFAKVREALVPIEDQWTLATVDGELFEEVEVESVELDKVIFRHKFGQARLPMAQLSEESQQKIESGYEAAVNTAEKAGDRATGHVLFHPASVRC